MQTSYIAGLEGSHHEHEGLTADGRVVETVAHEHEVELDLLRIELGLSYAFDDTWDILLRVPYFVKDQKASVGFPNGGTPEQRAEAERFSEIHHRTDTYEGLGDLEFLVGWKRKNFLLENDVIRLSLGFTVPTGDTNDDPYALGDLGLRHNHVLLGNGTFDPLLEFYYGASLSRHWAVSSFGRMRCPLYESDEGYQGSPEFQLTPTINWLPNKKLSFRAGLSLYYQDYAHWNGERDENTGMLDLGALVGVGYKFNETWTVGATFVQPIYDEAKSSGDSLKPAPVASLSVAVRF